MCLYWFVEIVAVYLDEGCCTGNQEADGSFDDTLSEYTLARCLCLVLYGYRKMRTYTTVVTGTSL